jgi:hypothetical protein
MANLNLDRISRNRSSNEWKEQLSDVPKMAAADKQKRLSAIMKEADGFQRVGNGMIGPIQIRLRYEGMVRNVLIEDTLERGPLMPYDVLDDLGMAYFLTPLRLRSRFRSSRASRYSRTSSELPHSRVSARKIFTSCASTSLSTLRMSRVRLSRRQRMLA